MSNNTLAFCALLFSCVVCGTAVYLHRGSPLMQVSEGLWSGQAWYSSDLLEAIYMVESRGDPDAAGEFGEVGILQIRAIMVLECNRISDGMFSLEDRRSVPLSLEMFEVYSYYWASHYDDFSEDGIARRWNGGPKGHLRDTTLAYWDKVRTRIGTVRSP